MRRPRIPTGLSQKQSFSNRTATACPHIRWPWMHGCSTEAGIKEDREAMAQAGVTGAAIFHVDHATPVGTLVSESSEWRF